MLKEINDFVELHQGLASWVQAIGSILAIIGAVAVVQYQRQLERRHSQETAAAHTALLLRAWVIECASKARELNRYYDSHGEDGDKLTTISKLPFKDEIAVLSQLAPDLRARALQLVDDRDRAIDNHADLVELMHFEDAEDLLVRELYALAKAGQALCHTLMVHSGTGVLAEPQWIERALAKAKDWQH